MLFVSKKNPKDYNRGRLCKFDTEIHIFMSFQITAYKNLRCFFLKKASHSGKIGRNDFFENDRNIEKTGNVLVPVIEAA